MTASAVSVLLGDQRPRVSSEPAGTVQSSGRYATDLARSVGLELDPWQQYVLEVSLGERADGSYSAFETGLIVSRQNGKGAIIEARELAGLFLLGERLILHSAHQFRTSLEAFRRMESLLEGSDLAREVKRVRRTTGEESIELHNGARLQYIARSGGAGRGFSGDCVILDEAFNLGGEAMSALLPTLSARPNPQVWYTSSAGMASSSQLKRVRERALNGGSPRLAYFEWSAEKDADLDDRAAWAQANPALGLRITEDFIAAERDAMPDEEFARERLGIWSSEGDEAVIPFDLWAACAESNPRTLPPAAFAVDVPPDRTAASVAVAVKVPGGVRVEVAEHQPGTAWVGPWLIERAKRHNVPVVVDPLSPAGSLLAELQGARVPTKVLTSREYGQACGRFYDAVTAGSLRHLDDPRLARALSAARTRTIGDAWGWARKDSTDISPLVAVTLALHGATVSNASTYEDRDPLVL